MALLAHQQIDQDGLAPVFVPADEGDDGGDTFKPRDNVWLEVVNASETDPTVVTIDSVALSSFGSDVDVGGSVPAAVEDPEDVFTPSVRRFGPFPPQRFADPETGLASVTYTETADVTVGVFRL